MCIYGTGSHLVPIGLALCAENLGFIDVKEHAPAYITTDGNCTDGIGNTYPNLYDMCTAYGTDELRFKKVEHFISKYSSGHKDDVVAAISINNDNINPNISSAISKMCE